MFDIEIYFFILGGDSKFPQQTACYPRQCTETLPIGCTHRLHASTCRGLLRTETSARLRTHGPENEGLNRHACGDERRRQMHDRSLPEDGLSTNKYRRRL